MDDELQPASTPTASAEKSPQIKLTLPTSEPIKNLFCRTPSPSSLPSPAQQRKQQPQQQQYLQLSPNVTTTKSENLKSKCDTSLNAGSATGK